MSSKIIKIIIILLLMFFVLAGGGLWFALQQPKFLANTALNILKKQSAPNVVFKEITLEKVQWSSWDKVVLHNVRLRCKINNSSYFFSAGDVSVDHFKGLFDGRPMRVQVRSLVVVNDLLNVSDIHLQADVYFKGLRYERSQGAIKASSVEWGKYLLTQLQSDFSDQTKTLELPNLQALFYGGKTFLRVSIGYAKRTSYDVSVVLSQVQSKLMVTANEAFSQMTAVFDGHIQLDNRSGMGISLKGHLAAPLGGSMKASLLRYLAQYVPQRQQIEDLIRKDADVPLNLAQADILSIDAENISSQVVLNSSSLNLDMKVKFDVHLEGGLEGLLRYMDQ